MGNFRLFQQARSEVIVKYTNCNLLEHEWTRTVQNDEKNKKIRTLKLGKILLVLIKKRVYLKWFSLQFGFCGINMIKFLFNICGFFIVSFKDHLRLWLIKEEEEIKKYRIKACWNSFFVLFCFVLKCWIFYCEIPVAKNS